MRVQRPIVFIFFLACKSGHDRPPPTITAATSTLTPTSTSTSTPTPTSTSTSTPTLTSTPTRNPDPAPAASIFLADASPPRCRVVRGPVELPVRAPPSLSIRADTVDVVLNEWGRPRSVSFPAGPLVPASTHGVREAAGGPTARGSPIPCATAGEWVFCSDQAGSVHRTTRAGAEDHVVASGRSTSRIAASLFAGGHVALGYLASRQTTEGWVSEAWLAVDETPPLRVSEDGSGATALALAPRGHSLTAMMIDARTALTAMHARTIAYDSALRLGEDAVVFVGGPGDRRTRAALAIPPAGPAWSLMPIARDVQSFGLAIVRLDDPPRVDEPVVWSMYPNGLDPAPVAAASTRERSPAIWVARVLPRDADPAAPRVLELGQITPDGAFAPRDVVPTMGNATDIALVVDAVNALWLAWVDGGGGWIERLSCR